MVYGDFNGPRRRKNKANSKPNKANLTFFGDFLQSMPVQLPNVLGQLASELEGTGVEAVILPLSLVWFEENPERVERNWPAEMMVKRFVEIVEAMARMNLPAVASRRQITIGFSKKRRATNQLCRWL